MISPAYDLNPTPTDLKARILTTNISIDEGTCSIELARDQATLFGLSSKRASEIIADVGKAVAEWRIVAQTLGQSKVQIDRMASAFEHNDLEEARP